MSSLTRKTTNTNKEWIKGQSRSKIMERFHRFRNSFRNSFRKKFRKKSKALEMAEKRRERCQKESNSIKMGERGQIGNEQENVTRNHTNVNDEKTTIVYNLSVNVDGNENEFILNLCGDCLESENLQSSVCKPEHSRSKNNTSIYREHSCVQKEERVELESKSLVQPLTLEGEHKQRLSVSRRYPKSEMKGSKENQQGKAFYGPAEHSNLGLSTFETGCSGLTVPSDTIPELDAPLQMDVLDTAPKQVATTMKVQKPTESITLPPPVPAHEETQVKQMAEESSKVEVNPASSLYGISSGYPIRSTSSGAEKTRSEMSLTSCEATQEPELCESIQFRSNNKSKCEEKMVFNDTPCSLISTKQILEHDEKEETSMIPLNVASPSCHRDNSRCSSQGADIAGLIILTERYIVYRHWLICLSVCCIAIVKSTGELVYAQCAKITLAKVEEDGNPSTSSCDEDAMALIPCSQSSKAVLLYSDRKKCISTSSTPNECKTIAIERRSMERSSILNGLCCACYTAMVISTDCWYRAWCMATALAKLTTECTNVEVSADDNLQSLSVDTQNDLYFERHYRLDESNEDSCYFSDILPSTDLEESQNGICQISKTCSKHVEDVIVQTCSVVEDPVCKTFPDAIPESKIIIGATQKDSIKCKGTRTIKPAKGDIHLEKVENTNSKRNSKPDNDEREITDPVREEKTLFESDTEVVDHIILGTTYTDEITLDSKNIEKPINDDETRENTGQLADNDFICETSNFAEHDEETEETKDQYSEKSVTIEAKKKQNQVPYVGLEDEIFFRPIFILESNHNIERQKSLIKYVHDSSPSIENEEVQYNLALSQFLGESVTKVKLRKNEKGLRNYFCKYCHRSRNKPNPKCSFNDQHETSSTSMGMIARSTEVENADIRREIGSIGSTSTDRSSEWDSGVFSQFASEVSSYTSSYDSLKRSLKADHCTDKERKHVPGKTNYRSGQCKPVDTEEKLRTQEKQLRDRLRRITSSWSYFTPESYNPYLYPGLQSYFQRIQDGEELSLQEENSYEWIRFQSFNHYRGNGSGIVLARNGFYHDREGGQTATRCYACDATYSEWEFFDEVERRHRPDCPHVHGGESGNIPIQPEADHDLQVSAQRPDHSSSDGDSREVNLAVTSERDTGNEDEATPAKVTEATGAQSNPPSVDMVTVGSQPSQDRENEQYMSSYVAHRDDATHLAVTSQDTHTSSPAAQPDQHSYSQSNRDTGLSLPYGSSDSPRLIEVGAGAQSGSENRSQPSSGQPSANSLPTPSSQAPISGLATSRQSSTAGQDTTYTSSQPSSDSSSSSSQPSSTESTSTQSQSETSTQSQATLSNPTSSSAQLVTSSQPSAPSQPVTVSEDSAASQLALSGAPIASSLNESRALQASGGRQLETPGHIQTHPELILLDSPKHPEYGSVDARANTFRGTWPSTLDQTPRRMAEAGFYYTGVADFTRCYACGGGLRNWEAGDDPVIEHTRWYPTCPYVTKLKGEKYVQAVIVKQQQHLEEKRKEQVALSQQRAAQRTPPDPLRSTAASVLSEMGYSQDRIKDAILAVRQQTGNTEVTAEQALIWILDDDERRSAIAARRAAGSSAFFSSSQASSTSATSSSTSATATTSSSSSSSSQSSAGTQQPAETGIKQPSTSSAGNQQSTETGIKQSASAGSQPPAASGSEQQGGAGSQPSSGSGGERSSLEAAGNQQGATGGAEDTKKSEGNQPSGGKSKRKKRNKKGGQSASLPAEGATGSSRDSPPNTAEGATGNSGELPPNTDTQSLRVENEKLRDIQTCKICLDKPVDTTFLPCGHLVCCGRCANKMRKCPICRKPIRGSVKTFMS